MNPTLKILGRSTLDIHFKQNPFYSYLGIELFEGNSIHLN